MALKQFSSNLIEISKERSIRFDVDFIDFQNHFNIESYYTFNDLFKFPKFKKVSLDEIDDDFYYVEIGNVSKNGEIEPVRLNFLRRNIADGDYYKKIDKGDIIQSNRGEILLSKVRPNLKKYILVDEDSEKYYFTSAFIRLEPKKLGKILYYCLRNVFFKNIVSISRQGKGYPTLKEDDFSELKFDKKILDKLIEKEEELSSKINSCEEIIKNLLVDTKPHQDVIDKIFTREFGFNIEKFEELSKIKKYKVDLSDFANNLDMRYSVKFHRNAGTFVLQELKRVTLKKIKHFISEPIVLGVSVSPSDYDENGDYYYVSMANIKNWKFEKEEAKLVSNDYSKKNLTKTVSHNDILIARSGEGTIGKIALIQNGELLGIFADFTMRIRLKDYLPIFAYYYFRTTYFQYLIEINKKGLGNNTNIFPNQIQELPMIDIPISRQAKIVDEIKKELDEQESIKLLVEQQRTKIDEVIEQSFI